MLLELKNDAFILNAGIQKRIDMDLLNRSIPGIYIYAVMLPSVFWAFDFYTLHSDLCLPYVLAMLAVSAIRILHKSYTDDLYEKSPQLWFGMLSLLTTMHAAIVGSIFALAIYDQRFIDARPLMMLSMAAIAGGSLMAQTPRVGLALVNMAALLVPSMMVFFFITGEPKLMLLLVVYYVYQTALGLRVNKEYIRGLSNEMQLSLQQKELKQINQIDPLTNIYNRGYFNTAYTVHWSKGVRNQEALSLLMIDADHFKSVNDHYGHLFGDECLKYIANTLQKVIKRETDLIARFGGEEFSVLLSNTRMSAAKRLAERICKEINHEPFSYNGVALNVTVSIGVACRIPQADINPNTLIDDADKALYRAKKEGRNRVCCDE